MQILEYNLICRHILVRFILFLGRATTQLRRNNQFCTRDSGARRGEYTHLQPDLTAPMLPHRASVEIRRCMTHEFEVYVLGDNLPAALSLSLTAVKEKVEIKCRLEMHLLRASSLLMQGCVYE